MKKIFAIALVMVLALSLLTACGGNGDNNNSTGGNNSNPTSTNGNNNNNAGDDKPDMSLPKIEMGEEWPTAYLPKDLPEFNAKPTNVTAKPGDVSISYVTSTTTVELMEYLNGLKSNGWTLNEIDSTMGTVKKGKWKITYSTGETTNTPGTFNHTLIFKYEG